MEKSKYQAFIFDMDGTIVDTNEDIADSVNYSLRKHGLKEKSYDEIMSFVGNGSVLTIQRAMGDADPSLFRSVFDVYFRYYLDNPCVKTRPYDGLIDALKYAKSKGILLFIYTNKPDKIAQAVMMKCFGKDMFEIMVGIPDGGKTKPDPEAFFKAAEKYHLDYSKCAYFGDSTVDLETADNLGIENRYSVSWGYVSQGKLKSFRVKPKKILSSPSEIISVVDDMI